MHPLFLILIHNGISPSQRLRTVPRSLRRAYLKGGNVVILYTIVVIKLFIKNEKLLKFSEKKEKERIAYFC